MYRHNLYQDGSIVDQDSGNDRERRDVPEFHLVRSNTQGVVVDDEEEQEQEQNQEQELQHGPNKECLSPSASSSKRRSFFKRLSKLQTHDEPEQVQSGNLQEPQLLSPSPCTSINSDDNLATSPSRRKRLSNIFSRSRSNSNVESLYVPEGFDQNHQNADDLKQAETLALYKGSTPPPRSPTPQAQPSKEIEERLQRGIDYHEQGQLEQSTAIFEELADPKTVNHPLAQVLYGLSLRHGWGCSKQEQQGFYYLQTAASNSALLDSQTSFGKSELILAIYELGNSFRYGWGCQQDDYAAKTYYETAAKLGDADAMTEVAWCYYTGFGTKKDKHTSAQWYRKAEKAGRTEVGNSWIWKPKYD